MRKVTKREIMFSMIIIFIMLTVGYFISSSISDYVAEKNEVYYKATKISDKHEFIYGMKTNIGNSLVYGQVEAIEPVSMPELTGKYLSVEKEVERYTRHTRTVTYTSSDGKTHTRQEVYYTWDYYGGESKQVASFTFLGVTFDSAKVIFPNKEGLSLGEDTVSPKYLSWVSGNYLYPNGQYFENVGDLRYSYNVVPIKFKGSILADLKSNTIYNTENKDNGIVFIYNHTPKQVVQEKLDSEDTPATIFWVIWILLVIGIVAAFVLVDNRWLEDKKGLHRE